MAEKLFTTSQVANLLGATPGTVMDWINNGWLDSRRLPHGPIRISEANLKQFLNARGIDLGEIGAKMEAEEGEYLEEVKEDSSHQPLSASRSAKTAVAVETSPRLSEPVEQVKIIPEQMGNSAAQVAEAIIDDALARKATHIHLEPTADGLLLRLRIDGVLHEKTNFKLRLPKDLGPKLIQCLKEQSDLPGDSSAPQCGVLRSSAKGRAAECEIATFPTRHGEKIVITIPPKRQPMDLSELGMAAESVADVRGVLAGSAGLVLVVTAPGSGSATTLESLVSAVDAKQKSVAAVSKRAGRQIEGVMHSLIEPQDDFAYEDAMASLNNVDTDVIMIDDLRGPAMIRAAVEQAYDGRLVIAGVRLDSATNIIDELLLMGADPWLLGASLKVVIRQRLVRKLCEGCKREIVAAGCEQCSSTGYAGRVGVFSVTLMDDKLARSIGNGVAAPLQRSQPSLRVAATALLRAGVTSAEEVAALPDC